MIVHIEKDEWWPVLSPVKVESIDSDTIDMPDELVERYKKADAEFYEVQRLLREYDDKVQYCGVCQKRVYMYTVVRDTKYCADCKLKLDGYVPK